jgi:hypothetical protein
MRGYVIGDGRTRIAKAIITRRQRAVERKSLAKASARAKVAHVVAGCCTACAACTMCCVSGKFAFQKKVFCWKPVQRGFDF